MAFSPIKFISEKTKELKVKIGNSRAIIATSGGVDSMTCAMLARKSLGENIVVLFLDDGLMREGEPEEVRKFFESVGINLEIWDVKESFFEALKGKVDPEEKRIAFRDTFYRTLGQAVKSYSVDFLIQGTIAADIVETQKGIKTQHNVLSQIGLNPATFGLQVVEPLRELYKHQVREVAKKLGLPNKFAERKPFPGPGLATRIIGEVVPERVEKIRKATKIVEMSITGASIFQVMAVLLSDKATGMVQGKRMLGDIIAIRAVESKDALTASPCKIPWATLFKVRDRILKEVPGVVKVVYDITPKPPSTIEYI
ncbi:MAG: 7-cyano-7-deazaguanine synthase [Candidatus Omnitrophica bacterium]|nr:7-cyano-7-deazaguanine synthase [Candidatus Omnitrophota bacterium]MCM8776799.1 7-cyano-7-deazaguanine synthase [Candidatus Omnitrophota bacterium]